jgi:hypothetical protein
MKDAIQLGDLPNHRPNYFPTFNSGKWFYRKHCDALLDAGVIVKINRRVLFDLPKLDNFIASHREV